MSLSGFMSLRFIEIIISSLCRVDVPNERLIVMDGRFSHGYKDAQYCNSKFCFECGLRIIAYCLLTKIHFVVILENAIILYYVA